jgi:ATP-dependent metalloprotease
MSDTLGNMDLWSDYSELSSETKQKIEDEVRRILDESYRRAYEVLTERRKDLDILAKALVEYEVLNADEMRRVLKGEKLAKLTANPDQPIKLPELKLPPGLGGGSPGLGGRPPGVAGGSSGLGDKIPGLESARPDMSVGHVGKSESTPREEGGVEL